jgi:acetyltransferase-like isoleucine patch superfamily enzyme/peptidoglycan/xylan/chitin deacetylase (PgdA/CDA1 family)
MLRALKLSLFHAARSLGVFSAAARSRRRSRQLLILCYHGISIDDEHEWAPGLYISPAMFESRLERLRRGGYCVLPLPEAVARLRAGTLPPRSVAITFDDGNFDFHRRAWPLLRQYGLPATVYLTTYYCERNLPVFPVVLSYLLWKGRGTRAKVELSYGGSVWVDATSPESRRRAESMLVAFAHGEGMSALEKDDLARCVARALGIDYDELREQRLLNVMNPDEVRELAAYGVDFELHTHRHRSPLDEERYRAELTLNGARIAAMTGAIPRHFCYPSGTHKPQFEQWLGAEGVVSATTCEPGIATRTSNCLRLPRLLDHSGVTDVEFDAWLCGLGALLPNRPIGTTDVDPDGRLVTEQSSVVRTPPERSLGGLVGRALREPGRALSYGLALTKGYWYRVILRILGRRFRAGSRFRVFGRLSVRGPGEVIFGDNVAMWGRVNAWTYSADARLVAADNVMMSGTKFACAREIRVGKDSILADASITDTDFHSTRADRRLPSAPIRVAPVNIGDNVWVAASAILLPGTTIGENCVVGAGAVCMRAFPANKVILGNPAKVAMPIPSVGGAALVLDATNAIDGAVDREMVGATRT